MIDVPRGVRALLYEQASLQESITQKTIGVFELWGFTKVKTPAIEFFDVLTKGLNAKDVSRVITFQDQAAGKKPLALRSDVTPQIARIAATTLAGRRAPIRLCYAQSVYRSVTPGAGQRMEAPQAGVELIGVKEPEADAEMIAIAIETLTCLGLKGTKISIGHVGYIKSALAALSLGDEYEEKIKNALIKKDQYTLTKILDEANAKGPARDAIEMAPTLFGGADILGKANNDFDGAKEALDNLGDVIEILGKYNLDESFTIDLGEIRGFGYYTGVTFEGFVKGIGRTILSGGRYDRLLKTYGMDRPATGFAIDLGNVFDYFDRAEKQEDWAASDILVVGVDGAYMKAAKLAKSLREKGKKVARDIVMRPLDESIDYAKRLKISAVVIVGKDSITQIKTASGNEKEVTIDDLL